MYYHYYYYYYCYYHYHYYYHYYSYYYSYYYYYYSCCYYYYYYYCYYVKVPDVLQLSGEVSGIRAIRSCVPGCGKNALDFPSTQRLQYPLIKEYTLNHNRDPTII